MAEEHGASTIVVAVLSHIFGIAIEAVVAYPVVSTQVYPLPQITMPGWTLTLSPALKSVPRVASLLLYQLQK